MHPTKLVTRLFALVVLFVIATGALAQEATPPPTAIPTGPAPDGSFAIGNELTVAALQALDIPASEITFNEQLASGANYARYIASYESEGNTIYGLLTVPFGEVPAGGFKAIVFNHGYIPPHLYVTTERYVAYVDALAAAGFVVFKIDMRGHGNSEGEAAGAYFSPAYSIDAVAAVRALQGLDFVDPAGVGMWGHSMAGNLTLRAMLMEPAIAAGVIWAGAVYSYEDFWRYRISDPSFTPNPAITSESPSRRMRQQMLETYGEPSADTPFWQAVSLTAHLDDLDAPLQIHHAVDDPVVNVGYSADLAAALALAGRDHELHLYSAGGHDIEGASFDLAMARTIQFFRDNL
jgi:uncharacterized protein